MKKYKLCAFADEAGALLSEQIDALKGNNIPCIELRNVDHVNVSDITVDTAKEIRKKLDAAGIAVWALGSPIGKIGIDDPFEPHLDTFKRLLEVGAVLDAKALRMFSFYLPKGSDFDTYKDSVLEKLAKLCEAAKGSGITLCHENEKGIFGDTASRCRLLLDNLPELKAVFDPANFIQTEQDTLEAWALLHHRVEYLHIKDAFKGGDVVPAGMGIGNLAEILSKFTGEVLSIEPHLDVFDGLSALEQEGEKSVVGTFRYSSNREAFDAAAAALRVLL